MSANVGRVVTGAQWVVTDWSGSEDEDSLRAVDIGDVLTVEHVLSPHAGLRVYVFNIGERCSDCGMTMRHGPHECGGHRHFAFVVEP